MKAGQDSLKRYCGCGVLVWSVRFKRNLPRYTETIICQGCGVDNSRQPTLWFRLRFGIKKLRNHIRAYGVIRCWHHLSPLHVFRVREPFKPKVPKTLRDARGVEIAFTTE